jgi:uncharacterized damage-inducible protein DinB
MRRHFQMFADYNRWANALVYKACADLTEAEYRADQGAFFGSAHRTLNHLLCADRIWLKRVTGSGEAPTALDTILHEDFAALREARIAEDQRIIDWIDTLDEGKLAASFTYSPISSSTVITQPLGPVLAHVFNHPTHHRGQVHMILTSLGRPSVVLDLDYFLRGDGKRWL